MNADKDIPFSQEQIRTITKTYPTPFHLYDEKGIRENARALFAAYNWCKGFTNYFAVKACPNPYLMQILKEEGMGADCSSLPELLLAEKVGLRGEKIMFTSNDTPTNEYQKAYELGAIINLDDITHIPFLEAAIGRLPDLMCLRFNPGSLREGGNTIIGKPEDAKYGFTKEQLIEGYRILKNKGVKRFGLHTMVVSNELNADYHVQTARMLFALVDEIRNKVGIEFEFVNVGGGIGIPYKPEQKAIDLASLGARVHDVYDEMIVQKGIPQLRLVMENGRMVTGPFGYLVTTAIHHKYTYKNYVGVDACMANLMRPGMYGAYHHITVLGKENKVKNMTYDIVGSLCENNDKFAIDRSFPEITEGDLLVIHNAGAHGHAMGFNYNGKLRSAELLVGIDGVVKMIRRAETPKDYFATLSFEGATLTFT